MSRKHMNKKTKDLFSECGVYESIIAYTFNGRTMIKIFRLDCEDGEPLEKIMVSLERFNRCLRHNPINFDKEYNFITKSRGIRIAKGMIWSYTKGSAVQAFPFTVCFGCNVILCLCVFQMKDDLDYDNSDTENPGNNIDKASVSSFVIITPHIPNITRGKRESPANRDSVQLFC